MESSFEENVIQNSSTSIKCLSNDDKRRLQQQDTRLIDEFKANMLEKDAKKHWDLFYKRNETRFFRDRHWTTREFTELIHFMEPANNVRRTLFEIGCGVGNFIFPLIEGKLNFDIFACDLSPRAVEIVKQHKLYDENRMRIFQCDLTTEDVCNHVEDNSVDIATLIFVLSAIHPEKFVKTLRNINRLLKPGGVLLFRDYGLYDMAQLRFKAGHKIAENFYMRQDGTRSYYFSIEYLSVILESSGYTILSNCYIHRRTVNKKENVDVPRIFVQAKARKPVEEQDS